MALAYKLLEGDSGIEMDDNGHPMVIDDADDDKEFGIRAIDLYAKIPALQAEAKKYREGFADLDPKDVQAKLTSFGEMQERLTLFGDIEPDTAKEAVRTVANLKQLDQDKNIEIEKLKSGVAESYKAKIKDIDAKYEQKDRQLQGVLTQKDNVIRNLLIRGAFDRSEFIKDKTVLTPDIAYDSFGKFFQVEEDGDAVKVFALDRAGEKIFSKANPGEYAPPEEAIGLIINDYPQKDSIMRTSSGGSGAGGNTKMTNSKRAKIEALKNMNPAERLNEMRKLA
jgi:hypothetical protein